MHCFKPLTLYKAKQWQYHISRQVPLFQSSRSIQGKTEISVICVNEAYTFQSSHLVQGETRSTPAKPSALLHFNPLAPCRVRPVDPFGLLNIQTCFNPLTPCGARHWGVSGAGNHDNFNPVARARDNEVIPALAVLLFQSGLPCEKRLLIMLNQVHPTYFNPALRAEFQSSHPVRGETAKIHKVLQTFCCKLYIRILLSPPIALLQPHFCHIFTPIQSPPVR